MFFAFRRRDLWISVVARAVSLLGDEAAVVALTLRMHDEGKGAPWVAALLAAGLLPVVLLAPAAGALVDRHDSRTLLVWSGLAQAAVCAVLANVTAVPAVLALVVVLGAGQAVNGATWHALLPSLVDAHELPAATGLSQAARTTAGIAAPALGGVLAGLYGTRVPLLLDAATFLAITAAGMLVRTRRHAVNAPALERGSYGVVRDDPVLLALVTMFGLFVLLGAMVNVVDVYLVRDTLGSCATWYGLLGGTWAAGMLIGSLPGRRWTTQAALVRVVVVSALALSVCLLGYAAAPQVGWLVPVAVAGGAANGLLNVGIGALTMMRAPANARGRVSAAVNGVASAAMIGAYVIGGALSSVASPRQLFVASGLLGTVVPLVAMRRLVRASESATVPVGTAA